MNLKTKMKAVNNGGAPADVHLFTADEAFAVTAGALRYALGRHTYSTSLVWNLIREHWRDPEVARQRECIYKDVSAYVRRTQSEWECAAAVAPVLERVAAVLAGEAEGCMLPEAKYALQKVHSLVAEELAKMKEVHYPDLDMKNTWLPAVEWMQAHMDDPCVGDANQ